MRGRRRELQEEEEEGQEKGGKGITFGGDWKTAPDKTERIPLRGKTQEHLAICKLIESRLDTKPDTLIEE